MKKLKRLLLLIPIVLGCLFMAACATGGTVDTVLKLNDDVSGVRVITVTVDEAAFAEYFSGEMTNLDNLAKTKCPECLAYSFKSDASGTTMTFELAFDSLDDYKSKVETLIEEPSLEINLADTAWSTGLRVYENFSSRDLLKWLTDAIVEEGYVSSDNSSYILDDGTTSFTYEGKDYPAGNRIQYDDLESVVLTGVDILTNVKDFDTFDRSFVFYVDVNSIGSRKNDIKRFFEDRVPKGTKISVDENSYYVNYSVGVNDAKVEDLNNLNNALFSKASFKAEDPETDKIFSTMKNYSETLPVGDYIFKNYQHVSISEYVKVPEAYLIYESPTSSYTFKPGTDGDHPGYAYVRNTRASIEEPAEISFAVGKQFRMSEVDITTKLLAKGSFSKEIVFVMEDMLTEEECDAVISKINAGLGDIPEGSAMTIFVGKKQEKKSAPKFAVSLKGDPDDIMNCLNELTYPSGEIVYAEDFGTFKAEYEVVIDEDFDLTDLCSYTTDDFQMVYTLDLGSGAKVEYCNSSYAVINGRSVTITDSQARADVRVVGTVTNIWMILMPILLLTGIGAVAAAFILGAKKAKMTPEMIEAEKARKAAKDAERARAKLARDAKHEADKQKRDAAKAAREAKKASKPQNDTIYRPANLPHAGETEAPAAVTEAPSEDTAAETADVPKCPKCGAPLKPGAKFCTSCGQKIE
ncbi:MAG: zinc ribbon domain-containing protein [Lachnospiraceae bacterium]|nr:zinc ribbon domain-containing protein [Lachnospiraceae bacterium]